MLFWSSLWISRTLQTNNFLFGEFRAFRGKNDHYRLWASPWNFGGKNKVEQDEIHTIHDSGYLYIKYGLGCFFFSWVKWHEIRVIDYKV